MSSHNDNKNSARQRAAGLQVSTQQNNFAGLGWGIALGAALGGFFGYQAGKNEEFRARMAWYRREYSQRMSEWYQRQCTSWSKRYQDWSEKNSGTVEA